ncbi:MAG: response regulator transcription factor [Phycisphaeraceae bacterium]|nr:response regulator transcription factor [Phycisphaeraceae bacterium]
MQIVIVDDDLMLLRSLELPLREAGHVVTCFADGESACRHLEDGKRMDALVLDYLLPDTTGADVLKRLVGCIPTGCRVILATGPRERLVPTKLLHVLGVQLVMTKPLDFEQLRAVIECSPTRA